MVLLDVYMYDGMVMKRQEMVPRGRWKRVMLESINCLFMSIYHLLSSTTTALLRRCILPVLAGLDKV